MTPDERFEADEKDRLLDTVAELRQQLANLNQPVVLSEWQKLQQENDQLRQQITLLRDALTKLLATSWCSLVYHLADTPEQRQAKEALAATAPKEKLK